MTDACKCILYNLYVEFGGLHPRSATLIPPVVSAMTTLVFEKPFATVGAVATHSPSPTTVPNHRRQAHGYKRRTSHAIYAYASFATHRFAHNILYARIHVTKFQITAHRGSLPALQPPHT